MARGRKPSKSKRSPRKGVKAQKTVVKKTSGAKKSRRALSDVKIAKLQKLYKSHKHSAQHLCDQFGISMATLFNYLKVSV